MNGLLNSTKQILCDYLPLGLLKAHEQGELLMTSVSCFPLCSSHLLISGNIENLNFVH